MILGICAETCLLFILPLFLYDGLCFTHWMVTDDGLTIKSVSDSPYHMVQPHSLVQFLEQERKLNRITDMRAFIEEHEKNILVHENADDPELETKIRKTDEDCITSGFTSINKDSFLLAYTLGKLVGDLEILASVEFNADKQKPGMEPHCIYDLQFSMYAFEHFPSVQQRDKLKVIPEAAFQQLLPPNYSITGFGSHVAKALETKPTSDSFLRLAALYWRMKGDAPKAVECFRRALHFTTKEMQARTQFDLGNLVHRAGYPSDAIVLYQLALLKINDAVIHMALADAYALVQNRSEAIGQYDIAFSLDPSMKNAQVKAAALKCDQKLINAMEEQHKNLLDTIREKNLYNDKYEAIKKLEESVKKNVVNLEEKVQSTLIYDYFTYGSIPYSNCRSVSISGCLVMRCTVSDWRSYQAVREEKHRKLVANVKRNVAKNTLKHNARKVVENLNDSRELTAFLEKLELIKEMNMDDPIDKPVYPRKQLPSINELLKHYLNSSWPNKTLCESSYWYFPLPSAENLPQLFLSPDNKGFRSSDLLGKFLGLDDGEEHPLPWHQPFCGIYISEEPLQAILKLPGIRAAAAHGPSIQFAEDKLQAVFLKLMDDKITEADIAQRIGTLMKYKIGPQWLVYNLAALYWRIVGVPSEAITCLRAALQAQFERYADVALVQLAQIVIRFGRSYKDYLSDAAFLMNSAIDVDPNEPITHILMGIVRILQKKHTTALAHVRAAVILDPLFQPAVAVLHALKCLSKNEQRLFAKRLHLHCCSQEESNVYCLGILSDRCFTVSKKGEFMGANCPVASKKKEDSCRRAFSFAPFILPLNPSIVNEIEKKAQKQLIKHSKIAQRKTNIDVSDEIPLDYGAEESLRKVQKMTAPSIESFFQSEILFTKSAPPKETEVIDSWEMDVPADKIIVPDGQLTLMHVPERRRMIAFDIPLPSKLPLPSKDQITSGFRYVPLPPKHTPNSNFCASIKMSLAILREQSTSTWLSVTAKGVNLGEFIDFQTPVNLNEDFEPVCPELLSPSPLLTLDHLPAYHLRHQFIHYKPEKGLTDAFLKFGKGKERIEMVAKRLKDAMSLSFAQNEDGVHWSLSTASALYWRVKGDAVNALKCLRQSLNSAPPDMRDIALVSMANIYQQAGLLHSALIAGGLALKISPKLVAIHFTLANIYASLEKYQHALMFYYSTLSMQSNFEPAKERIRTIYCFAENPSIQF
ncbi:unnamed protein product [Cercopithifilaria johnstoni]|uniref:Tetratricopeptide repeat protein 17 n=1 Tax=Cercopithifilaria johnstoni TaxID=2874296 RepID=A0A8J2LY84_9BILA|nr:unnamed protein product [Cercopithifilaria johnstoni]